MSPPSADDPERDMHLRAALRHAPDAGVEPPPALDAAILRAARTSAARTVSARPGPWARLRAALMPRPLLAPWAGGLAAVAVATMATLVWWDEPVPPVRDDAPALADATDASRARDGAPAARAEAGAAAAAADATGTASAAVAPAVPSARVAAAPSPRPPPPLQARAPEPGPSVAMAPEAPAPAAVPAPAAPTDVAPAPRIAQADHGAQADPGAQANPGAQADPGARADRAARAEAREGSGAAAADAARATSPAPAGERSRAAESVTLQRAAPTRPAAPGMTPGTAPGTAPPGLLALAAGGLGEGGSGAPPALPADERAWLERLVRVAAHRWQPHAGPWPDAGRERRVADQARALATARLTDDGLYWRDEASGRAWFVPLDAAERARVAMP